MWGSGKSLGFISPWADPPGSLWSRWGQESASMLWAEPRPREGGLTHLQGAQVSQGLSRAALFFFFCMFVALN